MPRCFDCGKEYTPRPGGDILMAWCYECRAKPKPPDTYIRKNGLFVINPEWERYEKENSQRQKTPPSAPTQKLKAWDPLATKTKTA